MTVDGLTLRDAFEALYDTSELAASTASKLRYHLARWERHSSDPPVAEIDEETLADFRKRCIDAGLSAASINTCWGDVRTILRRLGPRETGNPRGLGLLDRIPWMRPVKGKRGRPRRLSLDDIARVYVFASRAEFPRRRVPPCDWWRCLIVLAYTTGLRKGDLLRIDAADVNLEGGTLWFEASKTGKADEWPLHPVAVDHIRRIIQPAGRLFAGMQPTGGRFYQHFHAIQDAAGVERFGLHDIRRTAASEIERIRHGLGPVFLQHAPRGVSGRYYLNPTEELREAVESMRLPSGFKAGPKMAARAEAKAAEPLRIRAAEWHAPMRPDPADWDFDHGAFRFRGVWFRLSGKRLELLKHLVEAGTPVPCDDVQRIIGTSNPSTAQAAISGLRQRLRDALGMASNRDPLPCVEAGSGGAWTLHVPPDVKPIEPPPIPRTGPRRPVSNIEPQQLREARKRAGLSQGAVAAAVGVSLTHVSLWERGQTPIHADHAERLHEVLDLPKTERATS